MILTGQLDSPFVRRVAIALNHYGLAYERRAISAYEDFARLQQVNPLGTVPALALEDGTALVDSTLILDYLDRLVGPSHALMPEVAAVRARLLRHVGIGVGLAEKAVEFRTETVRRPEDRQDASRVDRVVRQIGAALDWLEDHTPPERFLAGGHLTHADIASAVAVTFIANKNPEHLGGERAYPNLRAHTARCEALEAFQAAPFGEE
jgi:glutathione S-transferase